MISVTEATATILSLSPNEPAITLALRATLSITQSRRGDVKTCCQPVDSFTLKRRITGVCTLLQGGLEEVQTGPLTLLKPWNTDAICAPM